MLLPVIVLVIYCFVPLFRRLEVTTAYEYLEARFSLAVRVLASAIFILFQLGRMGIVLLLPAIALSAVTGIDTYLCIGLMGLLATVYTVMGGIAAVIWTDVLQVFVLIGGALLCLVVTVADTGGLVAVIETAQAADKLHIFDWRWSTTDMVAWVLIVGFAFTNLVPYTTDQTVIQRYLTTRDEKQAAKSMWLNLAMTIPTGLLFYGLGTALWVYYMAHPAEQALLPEKVDQLVPWFVVTHLPAGVAGVVVAGIFAAAMSSLDSSMNSISAAVVNDFVVRLGGERHPQGLLLLARRLTCFLGFLGTGAAMVLATYEIRYLFDFFQKIMGLFGGGLAGVFLLAVFSRTVNAAGALAGLVTGSAATLVIVFFTATNFLLYAAVGTCTCVAVGYLVSCITGGETRNLAGLTLATLKDPVDAPR
ncbi:MAG: sodium/solute symporter, partial [Planctomycetota bacterium]|jgi:SSS family transporter|nr:sodium/solute symporter [Planctomycetota bacterium]